MNAAYQKLQNCLASIREKTNFRPEIAVILGSGLGDYAEHIVKAIQCQMWFFQFG